MTQTSENMNTTQYLTGYIGKQIVGFDIAGVRDVIEYKKVADVPLSNKKILGILNLRGQIVTAIDVAACLGSRQKEKSQSRHSVVIDMNNELYSLVIDRVGDVMTLNRKDRESPPATLDPEWKKYAAGIYSLENELLVILDIKKLLDGISGSADDQKAA